MIEQGKFDAAGQLIEASGRTSTGLEAGFATERDSGAMAADAEESAVTEGGGIQGAVG